MELIDILTAVGIGALIGFGMVAVYIWFLYQKIKRHVDQMIDEVLAEAEANLIGMDIEIDQNVYFCYNSEDKQFICQGTNLKEIREAFAKRFPNKTAFLAGGNKEAVAKLKEELKTDTITE